MPILCVGLQHAIHHMKFGNEMFKRQKRFDRLNIDITGITVFIIFPHQSPYIVGYLKARFSGYD